MSASTEFEVLALITVFFAAHLVVPGPNMVFLATAVSRGGRREALGFAFGTALGTGLWAGAAALGTFHLLDASPGLIEAASVLLGLALLALAMPYLHAAVSPAVAVAVPDCPGGAGRHLCGRALLRGTFVTLANANELVFWGAVMAILARVEPSGAFCASLAIACGMAALVFDLGFVALVSRGRLYGLLGRLRRGLEFAMGGLFVLSGFTLILAT